jgi:hypothetical protein
LNDLISMMNGDKELQLWAAGVLDARSAPTTTSRRVWRLFRALNLLREAEHDPVKGTVAETKKTAAWCRVRMRMERWLLQTFLPRFDTDVTTQPKHQLRMPWTINPKSGRPALPFDHTLPLEQLMNFLDVSEQGARHAHEEAKRVTRALHARVMNANAATAASSSDTRKRKPDASW